MNIGCHVSIAGGIQNAPKNAQALGCECFQMFTRAPQGGPAPTLTNEICEHFKISNSKFQIEKVYVHTPYYINFASGNNRIRYGSVKVVREELERGSLIGAKFVMTHLGSTKDLGEKEGIKKTIEMLQKSLSGYTGVTKLLIENSAGAGAIIGDDLKEIKKIVDGVGNDTVAGICLDTQHSFASGYDWNNFEKTLRKIDQEIGLSLVKLIHCNDSQTDLNSHRDRHDHIGHGKIGTAAFAQIVKFANQRDIDLLCETEYPGVERDIAILKKIRDSF